MVAVIDSPAIYIADTGTVKGRGVFAKRSFTAGDVVEIAPVVIVPPGELPPVLATMLFDWGLLASISRLKVWAFALGYGSLYNHANPANLIYSADCTGPYLRFTAARQIAIGEELSINYNSSDGSTTSTCDHWFISHGLVPANALAPAHVGSQADHQKLGASNLFPR